jgi:hypothetical protein
MVATLGLLLALAAPACDAPGQAGARAVEARVQIWTVSQADRLDAGPSMPDRPAPAILFASVVARGETVGEIAAQGLAAALDRRPGPRPERLFVSVLRPGAVLPFEAEAVRHGKTAYTLLLETPVDICR